MTTVTPCVYYVILQLLLSSECTSSFTQFMLMLSSICYSKQVLVLLTDVVFSVHLTLDGFCLHQYCKKLITVFSDLSGLFIFILLCLGFEPRRHLHLQGIVGVQFVSNCYAVSNELKC